MIAITGAAALGGIVKVAKKRKKVSQKTRWITLIITIVVLTSIISIIILTHQNG